ncbi:hypothetical protein MVEN_00911600 [Mycena venus]|uniref:Uncharacterized protein n=1 Tax=Mycena venus TaxID=2733690 RepID=A0A8H6Y7Q9_9AGAR|nr:hypothetical protein MVEN_00911600 [Mycena venus]
MVSLLSIVAAASLAAVASANHLITVKNTCGSKTITPIFHAGTVTTTMAAIGNATVVAYLWPDRDLRLSRWQVYGGGSTSSSAALSWLCFEHDKFSLTSPVQTMQSLAGGRFQRQYDILLFRRQLRGQQLSDKHLRRQPRVFGSD